MKKLLLLVAFIISAASIAQVTNEGKPASWKLLNNEKAIQTKVLPRFDLKALQAEDAINDLDKEGPWRFGYKHMVDFGLTDGKWTLLENGDRIWRMKFNSPGALTMNVIFDQFFMPEGGKLYLYNDDRTDLLGAYTAIQNQESGTLGTWIVKGETLWVEYYEPATVKGQGRLHFESITHGYRTADSERAKGLNDSGACNHDVDCPIGDDWEAHKENNKKSVAKILSGGSDWCTGALINNTANDGTPYFLTANHCVEGQNPANWAFIFGWISPNPICAGTASSTNGSTAMTISGASLRAKNAASDFCLVELSSAPPSSWDRTWAGWDKSDTNPDFVVGIHHPAGDIMKICRDDSGVIKAANGSPSAQTWEITTAGGGWEIGVTEGGSSGSPLFDQDGRIIGQLYGGGAACSGTNDNGQFDYYGRFGVSWATGSTDATKLQPWLDPLGSNPTVLDSYPPLATYSLDAGIGATIPAVDCGVSQVLPFLTLRNAGETTLTSATISWSFNGGATTEIAWTGSLAQNETENIDLGTLNLISGVNTLNTSVSNPNGGTDENDLNNTGIASYTYEAYFTEQIHFHLLTDDWCQETTWEFRNAAGTVLYTGGPYVEDSEDNTDFYYDFDVTPGQCYTFEIYDDAGDGICCDYGIGSYNLTTDNDTSIIVGGNFSDSETTEMAITASSSVDNFLANNIAIFPNPTNGNLNIRLNNLSSNFTYSLTNTIGQQVANGNLNGNNTVLDVSSFNNGVYFIRVTEVTSQKYMLKKIVVSK